MRLFPTRAPRLHPQRQTVRNTQSAPLEVLVEYLPDRYVLHPGDEMVIEAQSPDRDGGFLVVAYPGGLQVHPDWGLATGVWINGRIGVTDWTTPGPNAISRRHEPVVRPRVQRARAAEKSRRPYSITVRIRGS